MHENLHLMLEEQRHQAHMREADDYRRLKELRAARGHVSIWQRMARQFARSKAAPQQKMPTHTACDVMVCESI